MASVQTVDLSNGNSITLSLNGGKLQIRANSKGTHFIINTGDSDLILIPDARNKVFISATAQKVSVKQ